MAKFEIAESITGRNEGGYANNHADTAGETYAGIARNNWPKWEGWIHIDKLKSEYPSYKSRLEKEKKLKPYSLAQYINLNAPNIVSNYVSKFYKKNFWDALRLDEFVDQQLANSVYDFAVNSGTSRSAKYIQLSAGVTSDGIIGKQTLHAVNSGDRKVIYYDFNKRRETFYKSIAKGNQAQFLKSWLSRLKPYK